jgi:hypothetical protein
MGMLTTQEGVAIIGTDGSRRAQPSLFTMGGRSAATTGMLKCFIPWNRAAASSRTTGEDTAGRRR